MEKIQSKHWDYQETSLSYIIFAFSTKVKKTVCLINSEDFLLS
jgi:hypothetical protein